MLNLLSLSDPLLCPCDMIRMDGAPHVLPRSFLEPSIENTGRGTFLVEGEWPWGEPQNNFGPPHPTRQLKLGLHFISFIDQAFA